MIWGWSAEVDEHSDFVKVIQHCNQLITNAGDPQTLIVLITDGAGTPTIDQNTGVLNPTVTDYLADIPDSDGPVKGMYLVMMPTAFGVEPTSSLTKHTDGMMSGSGWGQGSTHMNRYIDNIWVSLKSAGQLGLGAKGNAIAAQSYHVAGQKFPDPAFDYSYCETNYNWSARCDVYSEAQNSGVYPSWSEPKWHDPGTCGSCVFDAYEHSCCGFDGECNPDFNEANCLDDGGWYGAYQKCGCSRACQAGGACCFKLREDDPPYDWNVDRCEILTEIACNCDYVHTRWGIPGYSSYDDGYCVTMQWPEPIWSGPGTDCEASCQEVRDPLGHCWIAQCSYCSGSDACVTEYIDDKNSPCGPCSCCCPSSWKYEGDFSGDSPGPVTLDYCRQRYHETSSCWEGCESGCTEPHTDQNTGCCGLHGGIGMRWFSPENTHYPDNFNYTFPANYTRPEGGWLGGSCTNYYESTNPDGSPFRWKAKWCCMSEEPPVCDEFNWGDTECSADCNSGITNQCSYGPFESGGHHPGWQRICSYKYNR